MQLSDYIIFLIQLIGDVAVSTVAQQQEHNVILYLIRRGLDYWLLSGCNY